MKTKKSLVLYFSVVVLLVVMCYGLKTTFAHFIATEQGTATNIKVAKLTYKLESEALENNALTLKPNEVKKINVFLTNEYDIATIYRLNYIGNVTVEKSSTSVDEVKDLIDTKTSKSIDLVITNNTNEEQTVIFEADGGYVGNELADCNITTIYDETLLQNKRMSDMRGRSRKIEEDNIKIIEPLHEDKWQQLMKKYPTVHPFSNSVAFLSIQPKDFIILQKAY